MRIAALFFAALGIACAQTTSLEFLNRDRPVLDAHNCYPYEGRWADRIDRALSAGFPVSIEQDLAWDAKGRKGAGGKGAGPKNDGSVVLSHEPKTTGREPLLRDYFFERVRPIVEKALAENDRAHWPLIILHFDFKSTEAPLLHAVWDVLGEYEGWITTAVKTDDPQQLSPLEAKPILVITEDSDEQEAVFYRQVPVGAKLRVFGSAHTREVETGPMQRRIHLAATLPPERLLTEPATNYRRWWNNSWFLVEQGGQKRAGDWTEADDRRLRALVDYAHRLGYWIRFYTLDGFPSGDRHGWDDGYNFGSRAAVLARWKAAIDAGVDFIATDQYEDLAAVMKAAGAR